MTDAKVQRKHPELTLATGEIVLVDEEDFWRVYQYSWYLVENGRWRYASCRRIGFMHEFIIGRKLGKMIHHKNDNGLDNRKSNIEHVTNQQNQARSRKTLSPTYSRFKGVSWRKDTRKWIAYIKVNYQMINLGNFVCEEDAAKAYDEAAKKYFGEYARTNF